MSDDRDDRPIDEHEDPDFWSGPPAEPDDDEPFWRKLSGDEPPDEERWGPAPGAPISPHTEPLHVPEAETEALPQADPRAEPPPPQPSEPPRAQPRPPIEDDELPSIEELTFARAHDYTTPLSDEAAERAEEIALEEDAAPATFTPHALPKRAAFTLATFAGALLPRGGGIEPSASDVGVPERLDAAFATWPAGARRRFLAALRVMEYQSVISRTPRKLSKLSPGQAHAALARAEQSRSIVRRRAFEDLKLLVTNQWASTAPVAAVLGTTYDCETHEPARTGERLEVLGYPQIRRDHVEECDVVVIGSGAGGAVAAKEMAEIGLSVVVIEEGSYYTRNDFAGPPFDRLQKLYRQAGMTSSVGRPVVAMPLGTGVGGSTLVNAGTCFRTPDRVLDRWGTEHGIEGIDPESMRPYFERVEKIQRVKPVAPEVIGNNARVFARGVQKLGLRGAPVLRTIEGCRGCGVCAFGCPSDAKLSTHLTYLPRAQRAGATIYANARAERILVSDGRAAGVEVALLDPGTREPKARLTVNARAVIVAAGAIHTPALLERNAIGNTSGLLGRNLSVHPFATVHGLFDDQVDSWRGTMQSYFVDEWHESDETLVQVTSSVPSVAAGTFPGSGRDLKQLLSRYPHLASASVYVSDTSRGRVIARGADEPVIVYRLNERDARRMVRGIIRVAGIMFAAGASTVFTGIPGVEPLTSDGELSKLTDEGVDRSRLRVTAYHPVGTARMGADPTSSVVDPWGQVHGVHGLFVADASVLPGCPTVNPQITIMAFATRAADYLARHGARYFG